MYAEISKEAFEVLTAKVSYSEVVSEHTELAQKHYYKVFGITVLQIYNHVSQVEQYYVRDINS